jgi:hypothetical protein
MVMKEIKDMPEPSAWVESKQEDGSIKLLPSHISVSQPDGTRIPIPTLEVTDASKMLGVYSCPAGDGVPHMEAMIAKGEEWVDQLKTRPLPPRDAWLSFLVQLYPAMSFGLGCVIISPSTLDTMIQALYYKILPLLGINRCIAKGWRMLTARHQGLGLPNFVVDCFAAKVHFVQCQWGFDCAIWPAHDSCL